MKKEIEREVSVMFHPDTTEIELLTFLQNEILKDISLSCETATCDRRKIIDYYIDENTRIRRSDYTYIKKTTEDEFKKIFFANNRTEPSNEDIKEFRNQQKSVCASTSNKIVIIKYELTTKKGNKEEFERIEKTEEITEDMFNILLSQVKFKVEKERDIFKTSREDTFIMIDDIKSPMKVLNLEIECDNKRIFNEILYRINKLDLKINKKNAWDYFNRKIGFCGAPSSGKTTLTRTFVNKLSIEYDANVEQVTEYARTHISRYGIPSLTTQPFVYLQQDRRENDASNHEIIVTDSPKFLTYFYTVYNNKSDLDEQSLYVYHKMYKIAMYTVLEYDELILLKPKEVKLEGVRYQDNDDIANLNNMIKTFLTTHNVKFFECDYKVDTDELLYDIFKLNKIPKEV